MATGFLLDAGFSTSTETGGYKFATAYYLECTWRSGTTHTIPIVGDVYSGDADLKCRRVEIRNYVDGNHHAGRLHLCYFDNLLDTYTDWLGGENYGTGTIVTMQGGTTFDTYTHPADSTTKWYSNADNTGTFQVLNTPVTVQSQTCQIGINATKRYRGTMTTLIGTIQKQVGCINTNTMWGMPKGTVLLTNVSANPLKETIDNFMDKVSWNVTYSYQIRTLLDGSGTALTDTWQFVFIEGKYQRLSKIANPTVETDFINMYNYATLPDDLGE